MTEVEDEERFFIGISNQWLALSGYNGFNPKAGKSKK
jgi:hypothetical protein